MDGTLLRGTTANLEVARQIGTLAELTDLEVRFAAGELDTKGFSAAIRALWAHLTPAAVTAAFAAGPWLAGIEEVCADIRRRGERSVVITMSPDFFARQLLPLGFDQVVASRFPELPFTRPLDPANVLTPQDKVRIVEELCADHGLAVEDCVAYGDSMSDAPLFRRLRRTVAVNADHHLAGLAALTYRGTSLSEAYALARTLLARPAPDRVAPTGDQASRLPSTR
ncbi:HAD family hydrolase [Streptomyces johnsoniae]|nr:haloacid dehalogenase-like hydrolase [Streptomyces sp. DSM 41886]